jgi:hypothetical protein
VGTLAEGLGLSDTESEDEDEDAIPTRGATACPMMKPGQIRRLQHALRHLTPRRQAIYRLMVHCLDRAHHAHELVATLISAILSPTATATQKLARFLLLQDLLANVAELEDGAVPHSRTLWQCLQERLEEVLAHLQAYAQDKVALLAGRMSAEAFRVPVHQALGVWAEHGMVPPELCARLARP